MIVCACVCRRGNRKKVPGLVVEFRVCLLR